MLLTHLQTAEITLLQLFAAVREERNQAEAERNQLIGQLNEAKHKLGYALSLYPIGDEYFIPTYVRNKPIRARLDDIHVDANGYSYTLYFSYPQKKKYGIYQMNIGLHQHLLQEFEKLNPDGKGQPVSDTELTAARLAFKQLSAARERQGARINEFKDPLTTIELLLDQVQKHICGLLFPVEISTQVVLPENSFKAVAGKFFGWIRDSDGQRTMIEIVSDEFIRYERVAFALSRILELNRNLAKDLKPLQDAANEWITMFLHDTYVEELFEKYGIPFPVIKSKFLQAA